MAMLVHLQKCIAGDFFGDLSPARAANGVPEDFRHMSFVHPSKFDNSILGHARYYIDRASGALDKKLFPQPFENAVAEFSDV